MLLEIANMIAGVPDEVEEWEDDEEQDEDENDDDEDDNENTIISKADAFLYEAKKSGKNKVMS